MWNLMKIVCASFALTVPAIASAEITEIIDERGDRAGHSLEGPSFIAVDAWGNVYVTGTVSDNAFKITPGGVITEILDATGNGTDLLDQARGVALDTAGNVYVSGQISNNAFKITDPCGANTITRIIDATGDGLGNPLDQPIGIAVDGLGSVYVPGLNTGNVFKVEDPCGAKTITEIIDADGDGAGNLLQHATIVAVDGLGNVYVTGQVSDNAFKIEPDGTITEIIDQAGDSLGNTLDNPVGIAVGPSGNVYVTGGGSNNVFRIMPNGVVTQIIDSSGGGGGNGLEAPIGVAVDDAENVYVAGRDSNNVFKITPNGDITEIIDATGDGRGNPLEWPHFIAVDDSGTVYVTGQRSDNAFKIELPNLDSLTPNEGPVRGRNLVTLSGSGFTTHTEVFFGGVPALSVALVDSTTLDVIVPPFTPLSPRLLPHFPGPGVTVDVSVVAPCGRSTLRNAYTYLPIFR